MDWIYYGARKSFQTKCFGMLGDIVKKVTKILFVNGENLFLFVVGCRVTHYTVTGI